MIVRSICYFKTKGERRAIKGDNETRPESRRRVKPNYR